jgi:iron complex transport system substrate-binding protein
MPDRWLWAYLVAVWLLAANAWAFTSVAAAPTQAIPAQRVVSLLPSLTEAVCVLGACQRLVGVDRYSNWPDGVKRLPRMGGGLDPDLEAIVAARPDLVLLATSSRAAARMRALGLRVVQLEPSNRSEARRDLLGVADALGLPRARADQVWQSMLEDVQAAQQILNPAARQLRVYVEVSPAPYGASEASFIGETLKELGVANILPASMGPFPKVNPELVVRAQPDVLILGDSSMAAMLARPGWSQMPAVRAGRVCAFSPEQADVLVRAGPRLAEAASLLVGCLNRMVQMARGGRP